MNFIFRPQPQQIQCYTEQKNLIKSHHFCLKVLTAMYELQSGNSLYNGGIKSKDIIRYMQEKFDLDGDVKTQIHISLQQSLAYGYITKESGKYKLVGPMAKVIQEPQDSEERYNEIDRVVKIFWSARKFTSCPAGKISGKETPLNLCTEEDEDISGSETMYPVSKRSRRRCRRSRSRASGDTGSSCQTDSTNVSKTSSRDELKRRCVRTRGRKRRVSTSARRRSKTRTSSRSRSRSRKKRATKRKKETDKSSSEMLLQSCDPDCTDPDCTCN